MAARGAVSPLTEGAQCSPHQTKIVDWFGPPHSFTVWHGPSLEWALVVLSGWLLCWERSQSGEKGDAAKHCIALFPFLNDIYDILRNSKMKLESKGHFQNKTNNQKNSVPIDLCISFPPTDCPALIPGICRAPHRTEEHKSIKSIAAGFEPRLQGRENLWFCDLLACITPQHCLAY